MTSLAPSCSLAITCPQIFVVSNEACVPHTQPLSTPHRLSCHMQSPNTQGMPRGTETGIWIPVLKISRTWTGIISTWTTTTQKGGPATRRGRLRRKRRCLAKTGAPVKAHAREGLDAIPGKAQCRGKSLSSSKRGCGMQGPLGNRRQVGGWRPRRRLGWRGPGRRSRQWSWCHACCRAPRSQSWSPSTSRECRAGMQSRPLPLPKTRLACHWRVSGVSM